MVDIGHRQTDEVLERLEKRLAEEYAQAYKEVEKKASDYFARFAEKGKKKKALVDAGELTEKDYQTWCKNQMLTGKRWTDLRDQLAKDLTNTNQIAAGIVRGELNEVFAINANYSEYMIENGMRTNYGFTLYNRDTIANLAKNDPDIIPWKPEVDIPADLRWNRQMITSHITQGILQGESIPNLSKRLLKTVNNDKVAAVRTARTAVTSSQNAGRQMVYDRAKKMGLKLKKSWMATLDGRTRHDHGMADGQEVDLDKPFIVGGEKMMYPGDMRASPHLTYNCRCTTITVEPDYITKGEEPRKTYGEWIAEKEKSEKVIVEDKKQTESPWNNSLEPRGQLPHINEDDLYSYVASEIKVDEQKAIEYTDAVLGFTDNSGLFTDVRKYQRGEKLDEWADMDAVKAISRDAEEYIKVAPRWNGGETYRGVTLSDKELSSYTVGSMLDMGGMSSWSSKKSVATDFAKRNATYGRPNSVMFHCDTQNKGTGIRHMSVIELEDEVLCSKDAKYEVLKIETQDDGITHIFLKEVEK